MEFLQQFLAVKANFLDLQWMMQWVDRMGMLPNHLQLVCKLMLVWHKPVIRHFVWLLILVTFYNKHFQEVDLTEFVFLVESQGYYFPCRYIVSPYILLTAKSFRCNMPP